MHRQSQLADGDSLLYYAHYANIAIQYHMPTSAMLIINILRMLQPKSAHCAANQSAQVCNARSASADDAPARLDGQSAARMKSGPSHLAAEPPSDVKASLRVVEHQSTAAKLARLAAPTSQPSITGVQKAASAPLQQGQQAAASARLELPRKDPALQASLACNQALITVT